MFLNFKEFIKSYWTKLGIALLILLFVVAYLVGLIFQYGDAYQKSVQEAGGMFSTGVKMDFSSINFNPITVYAGVLANRMAWPICLIFYVLVAGFTLRVFSQFLDGGSKDKARGFKYSKGGAYGTAGWLTIDDLDGIARVDTWKSAEGYILGQLDTSGRKLINSDPSSRLNKHVAVFGASGTGKSRCYSRNYFFQAVKRKESVIVTDPKGELFEDTAQFFRDNGYVVKIFNLVNPDKSDSWNCLKEIKGNEIMAQVFADTVIKNTNAGGKGDHFWDNSEMNLLKALILRVERGEAFKNINKQTMGTVYELLTKASGESGLDELFNPRTLAPDEKCCVAPYNIFKQAAENVRGGIILGLGTRLQVFQNEVIKKITEYDDIDLTLPGKRPCAYFCIMSDQDSTLNFLSSLFFSFLFIDLVRYADFNGGRCDTSVNFILDEFPNIGQIVDFTKKISTVRSRGLNISVIFQAVSQLENRYPDGMWQEILGNCDTHLFLGCNDPNTAKFISDRAGEVTIKVGSAALNKNTRLSPLVNKGVRESVGEGKRKLLTMDEVMRTPLDECLIIFRGQNALKAYKYDYSNHPRAKEFIKTYIREYPSIFDKELLMKEEALRKKEKEQAELAAQAAANEQAVVQPTTAATGIPSPITPPPQPVKPVDKPMSDLDKLKAATSKTPQPQPQQQNPQQLQKPKKDIFLNSNQNNQNQQKNISSIAANTQPPVDENNAVDEIIIEGEILEGFIEEPVATESTQGVTLLNQVEKNYNERFDKSENMLHNIEEDINNASKNTNTNNSAPQNQSTEDVLDALLSPKSDSQDQSTSKPNKKIDPIFGKDFTSSIGKTWKPGDVSQRTKEKLEQKGQDVSSSETVKSEPTKPTKNGLSLTKRN